MTATQAREKAAQNAHKNAAAELMMVWKAIEQAVNKGGYQISLSADLSAAAQAELKSKGYRYSSTYDQRDNETFITISW